MFIDVYTCDHPQRHIVLQVYMCVYSDTPSFHLKFKQNMISEQLTVLLKDVIAVSTSSSEENVTNPNPLDFEVPGTRDTFALRTFPFSEKYFSRISVVTVFARFPT